MNPIRSVVAATDLSRHAAHAVERAALIAVQAGARLKLLHVLPEPPGDMLRALMGMRRAVEPKLLEDARSRVLELAQRVRHSAVEVDVRSGTPFREIMRASARADLLALGAQGLSRMRDMVLGSTAERLLSRRSGPVLVVKSAARAPYRKVLVAVDFSVHTREALTYAAMLAPEAQLMALHAFVLPYEGKLWLADVSERDIRRYREQGRREAAARLEKLLAQSKLTGRRVARIVFNGDAAPAILDAEKRDGIDLIVMGKHGDTPLSDLFLGSITRRVLSESRADVLVVRSPH